MTPTTKPQAQDVLRVLLTDFHANIIASDRPMDDARRQGWDAKIGTNREAIVELFEAAVAAAVEAERKRCIWLVRQTEGVDVLSKAAIELVLAVDGTRTPNLPTQRTQPNDR